jgi:hypothetical protein
VTDLNVGILAGHGLTAITLDYVVVDTLRVPRGTFSAILEAWRDGYAESVAQVTRFPRGGDRVLRSNDRHHPRSQRLRGVEGAGRERARAVGPLAPSDPQPSGEQPV